MILEKLKIAVVKKTLPLTVHSKHFKVGSLKTKIERLLNGILSHFFKNRPLAET